MKVVVKLEYGDQFVVHEDRRWGNPIAVPESLLTEWRAAAKRFHKLNERMLKYAQKAQNDWLAAQPKTGHPQDQCPNGGGIGLGFCGECYITGNEESPSY